MEYSQTLGHKCMGQEHEYSFQVKVLLLKNETWLYLCTFIGCYSHYLLDEQKLLARFTKTSC